MIETIRAGGNSVGGRVAADELNLALQTLAVNAPTAQTRDLLQGVLDSERFNLLRTLEFFGSFGDVELWEFVPRAKWRRFPFGLSLYKKG